VRGLNTNISLPVREGLGERHEPLPSSNPPPPAKGEKPYKITSPTISSQIARRFKLSNREAEKLLMLTTLPGLVRGKLDPIAYRRALYEHGADACRDAALLAGADNPSIDLEPVLEMALSWQPPVFPLTGVDLLKLGAKPGAAMGEILRGVEAWWIERDFRPTHDECLAEAKRRAA